MEAVVRMCTLDLPPKLWLLSLLAAGVFWPTSAVASGFGDLRAVGTMAGLLGIGVVLLLLFTLYLLLSKTRTLGRWPNFLLLVLLTLLSQAAVQALNNLFWDQLYQGSHFTAVALCGESRSRPTSREPTGPPRPSPAAPGVFLETRSQRC